MACPSPNSCATGIRVNYWNCAVLRNFPENRSPTGVGSTRRPVGKLWEAEKPIRVPSPALSKIFSVCGRSGYGISVSLYMPVCPSRAAEDGERDARRLCA